MGAMRTCPRAKMEAVLDLMPVYKELELRAEETNMRIMLQSSDIGVQLTY